MNEEKLEARIKTLENQVITVQDIHEIEKLQRAYGYYLEHWMAREIIDLFADGPDVYVNWPEGKYLGKESVKRYFEGEETKDPEFLHQLIPLSPIIDIEPDGKTAKGRWYCWGVITAVRGGGVSGRFMSGIYESEYVKEGSKWKIKGLNWQIIYGVEPGEGLIKPERVAAIDPNVKPPPGRPRPDIPDIRWEYRYPSGYIFPFHFKHPVTGEKTSEEQRNLSVKRVKRDLHP